MDLKAAMSEEMKSQGSDASDQELESDYDEDMDDEYDYYDNCDYDIEHKEKDDPEYFDYELLPMEGVERLLNECVEALCKEIKVQWYLILRSATIFDEISWPFWMMSSARETAARNHNIARETWTKLQKHV